MKARTTLIDVSGIGVPWFEFPVAPRVSLAGQVPTFAKKQFWRFLSVLRDLGLV